jgi:hypothetical protein
MSTSVSIVRGSERSTWRVAGLALGAALLMGASARADGDFENGFEDQLGRILAFEAVQAAKAVLFYGAPVPVAVPIPYVAPSYYAPTVVVGSSWWPWYSAPRGHDHGHRHHYTPPRHHRHDRYCGHGGSHGGFDRGRSHGSRGDYRGDHRSAGYGYRDRDDDRSKGRGHGPSHGRARGRGDSRSRYARR